MAKETVIGLKMVNSNLNLLSPKHCFLSTCLLLEKEKKESSKWEHYIEILPKDYTNFPIFYTDEEKVWLKGSPFLSNINN